MLEQEPAGARGGTSTTDRAPLNVEVVKTSFSPHYRPSATTRTLSLSLFCSRSIVGSVPFSRLPTTRSLTTSRESIVLAGEIAAKMNQLPGNQARSTWKGAFNLIIRARTRGNGSRATGTSRFKREIGSRTGPIRVIRVNATFTNHEAYHYDDTTLSLAQKGTTRRKLRAARCS